MGILVDTYGAAVSAIKGLIGKANGIASLGADGKVPAAQLPTSGGGTVQDATTLAIKATDEGSPAGNTRGDNAVDLQTDRSSASQAATGSNAVLAGGLINTASGFGSVVGGGRFNRSTDTYAAIAGGESNLASGEHAAVAGGRLNTASADHGFVGGGESNTASGSAHSTVAGGWSNQATNAYATVAGGRSNVVTGSYSSILGGEFNEVSEQYASIIGGERGAATRHGEVAHSAGRYSGVGDCQRSVLQSRNSTTDASQAELFTNGSSKRITLANTEYLSGRLTVFARRSNGDFAKWTFEDVTADRIGSGNVTVTVGAVGEASGIGPDIYRGTGSTLVVDVNADTSNQALRVQVTGNASENWRWHAIFDAHRGLYGS